MKNATKPLVYKTNDEKIANFTKLKNYEKTIVNAKM